MLISEFFIEGSFHFWSSWLRIVCFHRIIINEWLQHFTHRFSWYPCEFIRFVIWKYYKISWLTALYWFYSEVKSKQRSIEDLPIMILILFVFFILFLIIGSIRTSWQPFFFWFRFSIRIIWVIRGGEGDECLCYYLEL